MAQYEQEVTKEMLLQDEKLSEATKDAIQALIQGSALLVGGPISEGNQTDTNLVSEPQTNFQDAEYTKVQTAVFDEGTQGTVNLTNNEPVTAELVNVKELTVNMPGKGNNSAFMDGGQASVNTGDGNDLFDFKGKVEGEFSSGSGDDSFVLDPEAAEQAAISVDAGEGFDMLRLLNVIGKHQFTLVNGQFHMHSADVTFENGVEVVVTDADGDGHPDAKVDHITILAQDAIDSLTGKLYKIALGREAIDGGDGIFDEENPDDTLAGIKFWTNYEDGNAGRAFLNCREFHEKYDGMGNEEYVNTLFSNLGCDDAALKADLLSKMNSGALDQAGAAIALAESDVATKILGIDGEQYVLDDFVDTNA
jgi:hypothetical protein